MSAKIYVYKIIIYSSGEEILNSVVSKEQFDNYATLLKKMNKSKENPKPVILTLKILDDHLLILSHKNVGHNDGQTISIYTIPKSSPKISIEIDVEKIAK